jgi:light-regulated signal transduction histidine kinase (bacteriophytochrome)
MNSNKPMLGYEEPHIMPDGRELWLSTSKMPLRDSEGNVIGVLGTYEDITLRREAQEKILSLNEELEERVNRRTAQLENSNKELEAFSYSVSHDLRAPLRGITGFTQILLEDYEAQLDAEGQRYLRLVSENARKMGILIDDLLTFSRLNRHELKKQTVQIDTMARECLDDLRPDTVNRRLDAQIAEMPPCEADPSLLKLVLTNLLSNALKFTGKRDVAQIEVGCVNEGGKIYFVKDNGVGFDMRYADKLFGVFQRLHRAEDYEGTGVGLANVQRIIARHGGRIWAEAELDKGATFYFTLEGKHGGPNR